jgi:hypothetical protein
MKNLKRFWAFVTILGFLLALGSIGWITEEMMFWDTQTGC